MRGNPSQRLLPFCFLEMPGSRPLCQEVFPQFPPKAGSSIANEDELHFCAWAVWVRARVRHTGLVLLIFHVEIFPHSL